MSNSLKGFIPDWSHTLGISADALYERQRSLVRAELLHPSEGRGPGSGVRATAPAVALLLISIMSSEGLADSPGRVRALAAAKPAKGDRCPLTHAKSFLDAFATILGSRAQAAKVVEIIISRTADRAQIKYGNRRAPDIVEFIGSQSVEPGLSMSSTLGHQSLNTIAKDIFSLISEKFDEAGQPA